jgi:ABC-type Fe3+-hydroxamate transport system substrate-binding protein
MRSLLLWLATSLTLSAGGQRIASYAPGATRTLVDLGCAEDIVMATRWCPLPREHPARRDADVFQPDLERLLQAKPDLVILPRMANPLWADKCAKAGLRILVLHPEARDSASRDIQQLGQATGRAEIARQLARPLAGKSAQPIKRILVIWDGVMAGPDSYLVEPLAAAGLAPALAVGSWIKFDWELVAAQRPDAILWVLNSGVESLLTPNPEKIAEWRQVPAIRELPCVREGHLYRVNNAGNWLPGSGLSKIIPELTRVRSALGN